MLRYSFTKSLKKFIGLNNSVNFEQIKSFDRFEIIINYSYMKDFEINKLTGTVNYYFVKKTTVCYQQFAKRYIQLHKSTT